MAEMETKYTSNKRDLCHKLRCLLDELSGRIKPKETTHKRPLKPKLAKLTISEVAAIARKEDLSYGQVVANDYAEALKNTEEEKE